ncbi:transglycosylase SLT domain-containing protein [Microvirga sp. 3-52]|nr:transglycosylase SLT domain-containing protein [Microvirga sp. 3-52]MBS7454482.1 transglycosylase SLT domain-containing protein [Microvirga sp. 3-52]
MFLVLFPSSGSAEPDFNALEIDVDWQLASLPQPPDLEPLTTSAILDIASPSRALKERSTYLPVIADEAAANGVPPALVDAVVRIESRYDPTAVGSIGEIGLMQVRPKTAALLGFQGTSAELAEPRTNLRYGVGYLAKAWRLADGDLCRALMKYRAGHGSDKMSALSIEYCRRARQHLAAVGTEIGALPGALAQPRIRTSGKDIRRGHPIKRTISAPKASRPQVREWVRLSRIHEAASANRAWSKKHRFSELARQKARLARLEHRTSSRTIHWKLAVPKRWVASR